MGKLKKLQNICLKVTISLVALVVLFVAAELGYRVYRDGHILAFDKLRESFSVPYSNLGTGNRMIYDEELGFRLNPAREGINKRSVRHKAIIMPKPEGLFRVVVLGDSLSWSWPSYVDFLRTALAGKGKFEVINAGIPGYTAFQEVGLFEEYLDETDPDLVIWSYCLNDNHRFLHKFDPRGHMLMTDEALRSLSTDTRWDALISHSYLLTLARVGQLAQKQKAQKSDGYVWKDSIEFNNAWKDHTWGDYEKQLVRLKGLVGEARMIIVAVPYEPQVLLRADKDLAYVLKPQSKVSALCIKHRIHCMDLFSEFAKAYDGKKKLYTDGIHLNEDGHRLAKQEIMKFLVTKQVLP